MLDEKMFRDAVAANVVRLRNSRGWSQGELATKLGISRIHLNRIENAKASPSAELLFAIADIFEATTDSFRQVSENISANAS